MFFYALFVLKILCLIFILRYSDICWLIASGWFAVQFVLRLGYYRDYLGRSPDVSGLFSARFLNTLTRSRQTFIFSIAVVRIFQTATEVTEGVGLVYFFPSLTIELVSFSHLILWSALIFPNFFCAAVKNFLRGLYCLNDYYTGWHHWAYMA